MRRLTVKKYIYTQKEERSRVIKSALDMQFTCGSNCIAAKVITFDPSVNFLKYIGSKIATIATSRVSVSYFLKEYADVTCTCLCRVDIHLNYNQISA